MAEITIISRSLGEKKVLVDDADLPILLQYKWHVFKVHQSHYARAFVNGKLVYMHRLIMNQDGLIDHINGNGLDNRRENLRVVTYSQNNANRNRQTTKRSSQYKGVFPDLLPGRTGWWVTLRVRGKKVYVGHYTTEEEAALAYDRAALLHFGEYARLNFHETARQGG